MSNDKPRRTAPAMRVPNSVQFGGKAASASAAIRVGEDRTPQHPGSEASAAAPVREKRRNTYLPVEPRNWEEAGVDPEFTLELVLRMLVGQAKVSGKQISDFVCLPLPLTNDVLNALKHRKLIESLGTNAIGDHLVKLTEAGKTAAEKSRNTTTYVGPAPVPFERYVDSIGRQSGSNSSPGPEDLRRAFSDLDVSDDMLERLGPAVTSGRSLFLYGPPGNGKTSLAERITRAFGDAVWIPRTLICGGAVISLFDPAVHKPIEVDPRKLQQHRIDRRWVFIERPTVITGGELTLDMLELQHDQETNISEAPLQLKANNGTLVIDDFGRGHTSPNDLLNRWIFPLEKRYDFLKLPDGRKVECPFDCLLVFSTNLEPRDLADEAFMRRIPYKIYANNPDEEEFKSLVASTAAKYGIELTKGSVKYLVDRHYKMAKREFRFCHPRDLLQQVVHYAEFTNTPKRCGPPEWDRVVSNYFGLS